MYVIDNGNNETRDVSRDKKKLINFTWPYICARNTNFKSTTT